MRGNRLNQNLPSPDCDRYLAKAGQSLRRLLNKIFHSIIKRPVTLDDNPQMLDAESPKIQWLRAFAPDRSILKHLEVSQHAKQLFHV